MRSAGRVLVTGSEGRVGRLLCMRLRALGHFVIGIDQQGGDETSCSRFFRVDLSQTEALLSVLREIRHESPQLDGIVACAATGATSPISGFMLPFGQQSDEAFARVMSVNVQSVFTIVRELAANLEQSASPAIVLVSSIYGMVGPSPGVYTGSQVVGTPAAYAASKGALISLGRFLASTIAPKVRTNVVCPGGIQRGQDEVFVRQYENFVPLRRMATEDDVVKVIVWLLGNDAAYLNGVVLPIDGGWTAL